jgi:hypothetical protein
MRGELRQRRMFLVMRAGKTVCNNGKDTEPKSSTCQIGEHPPNLKVREHLFLFGIVGGLSH